MRKSKAFALGIAALVLGLAIGGVGTATAATGSTTQANPVAAAACGLGLRLGAVMRDSGARLADVVAKLTGQSVEDVTAARAAGSSYQAIAAKKGVSADKVVDTALDAREAILDAKVKDGTITQAQADAALANMETRLTERVSSTAPGCGSGQGGGMGRGQGGGGMGRGRGGNGGCGGTCTQTTTAQ